MERLVKTRPSTIFGHLEYSLDYPGPLIEFLVPHEEFLNSAFGIWLGGEKNSDGCCIPIGMHKVWKALGLRQHRVEQLSSLRHEVSLRRARVVPGKNVMAALIIALKEEEIKAEAIPVHMHHRQTAIKNLKYMGGKPPVVVNVVHIN